MTSREAFEADAGPLGFSLTLDSRGPYSGEPWTEYVSVETGHRWAGWQARDAEIAALRDALCWYRDEAEALAMHMQGGAHTQAVLASLTVLSLDGGSRARAAIDAQRKL
jgi:hypothetical protein